MGAKKAGLLGRLINDQTISTEKSDERPFEVGDLLVEGEEQEYFLELLMRRVSPERPKENLPAKDKADPARRRKGKNKEKKARRKNLPRGQSKYRGREER